MWIINLSIHSSLNLQFKLIFPKTLSSLQTISMQVMLTIWNYNVCIIWKSCALIKLYNVSACFLNPIYKVNASVRKDGVGVMRLCNVRCVYVVGWGGDRHYDKNISVTVLNLLQHNSLREMKLAELLSKLRLTAWGTYCWQIVHNTRM